jgi:hypothetical protein
VEAESETHHVLDDSDRFREGLRPSEIDGLGDPKEASKRAQGQPGNKFAIPSENA